METPFSGEDVASTKPGGPSKIPVCAGPGGRAWAGDSSSNRSSLAFSDPSLATWFRSAASSRSSEVLDRRPWSFISGSTDMIERYLICSSGGSATATQSDRQGTRNDTAHAMVLVTDTTAIPPRRHDRPRQHKVTGSHEPLAVPARMGSTKMRTMETASPSVCSVSPRTLRASIG